MIIVIGFELEETRIFSYSSLVSSHWLTGPELCFQGSPTMERLAAVSGLVALVGSEGGMIQVRICLFFYILILYIYLNLMEKFG